MTTMIMIMMTLRMVMMVIITWRAFVGDLGALDNDERFRVWCIFNSLDDIGHDHDDHDGDDDSGTDRLRIW